MKIGAHVSVAGGLINCFKNAEKIEAEVVQIFGSSPVQWWVKKPTEAEIVEFKKEHKKSKVGQIFLHASYLVNLGSPSEKLWHASISSLAGHLKIAEDIGADGLVFHVGSGKDSSKEEAIVRAIEGMRRVLKEVSGKTSLIIENSAGAGLKLGNTPEEIGKMFRGVKNKRIKVCLDTAHAFEAGILKYTPKEITDFVKVCDKEFGWKNVVCIHLNDSKTEFDSKHDRHENVGEGFIGLKSFQNLAKNKDFKKVPWILEVPGFDNNGPDKKNIEILKKMEN